MGLGPAIVAALLGAALGIGLIVQYAREVRQRRLLRLDSPDFTAFDGDIQRYLERVWLMIGAWKPRVGSSAPELEEIWNRAVGAANSLQASRAAGDESADLVGELVRLEAELEAAIERLVSA